MNLLYLFILKCRRSNIEKVQYNDALSVNPLDSSDISFIRRNSPQHLSTARSPTTRNRNTSFETAAWLQKLEHISRRLRRPNAISSTAFTPTEILMSVK